MRWNLLLGFIGIYYCFGFTSSQKAGEDSECYTPNGRDYEGTQSVTYVKGSRVYDAAAATPETCVPWTTVRDRMNVTNFDKKLPNNYCRNPNDKLFPYCYVRRQGQPVFAYCHIPTCNTPALLGCFKLTVQEGGRTLTVEEGGKAPSGLNVTGDVILSGADSMDQDPLMKIGRCLNFCRSKKYDYAGVTGGNTCLCGKKYDDSARIKDTSNLLRPGKCYQYPCADDRLQACGGDDAIAIYDVAAGSCNPTPIHDKDSGVIYSPRWPGKYHNDAQCQWTIYVPDKYLKDDATKSNYQLKLQFTYFQLEKANDTLKLFQYVNSSTSISHGSYSGSYEKGMPPIYFRVSETVAVHMIFNTDKDHKHDGFILKYAIIYTGPITTTTVSTTTITTTTTTTTTTPKPTTTTTKPTTTTTPNPAATTKSTTKPTAKTITTEKPKTTSPTTPSKTDKTTNSTKLANAVKQESSSSLSGGAVAGVVIGVLIFVVLCIVAAIYVRKHLWSDKAPEAATFNNPVNFNSDTPL